MRYVWLVEGEPYAGSLDDYAKALEEDHYSSVGVSKWIWIASGPMSPSGYRQLKPIEPEAYNNTYQDILTVYLTVGEDEAHFRVDLRA